ncbi:MAG TPA: hypothetical protein EYP90_08190, partial [Chromatiaceae bacterium]|nr:hypothetical protein [Chromatiaceae bacterium]
MQDPGQGDAMTTLRQPLSRAQGDFMSLTIPQLIGVFWRRKWIIGTTLFTALCIAVIANGVITPRYTATASVIVEPRQQNVIEIESVMSSLPVSLETMQSEVQIIQSPTLARQVIDGLGLAALAEFNPALLPRERSVVDEVKSGIKGVFRPIIAWLKEEPAQPRAVELAEAPGAWDLDTEQVQQDWGQTRIVNRFLGRLNLAIQGSSRVISMSFLPFVLASFVGRGARFFLVAGLMAWGGEAMEERLHRYVDWIGWGLVVIVAAGMLSYRAGH